MIKLSRLVNRLDHKVYRHVENEVDTYVRLMGALDKLYTVKVNSNVIRNRLLTTSRMMGETVQSYQLRLEVLARQVRFPVPESEEANRQEWVLQAFIRGINSGEMRQKILEKEDADAETIYNLAKVHERSISDA